MKIQWSHTFILGLFLVAALSPAPPAGSSHCTHLQKLPQASKPKFIEPTQPPRMSWYVGEACERRGIAQRTRMVIRFGSTGTPTHLGRCKRLGVQKCIRFSLWWCQKSSCRLNSSRANAHLTCDVLGFGRYLAVSSKKAVYQEAICVDVPLSVPLLVFI